MAVPRSAASLPMAIVWLVPFLYQWVESSSSRLDSAAVAVVPPDAMDLQRGRRAVATAAFVATRVGMDKTHDVFGKKCATPHASRTVATTFGRPCLSDLVGRRRRGGAGPWYAGFGGGGPQEESSQKKKKKKKKKSSLLLEEEAPPPTTAAAPPPPPPRALDRFGLPLIPTEEELFPPPTRTIHAGSHTPTHQLSEIRSAVEDEGVLPLDWNLFNDQGVEEPPSSSTKPMKLTLLHKSPPVLTIEDFFTAHECQEYQDLMETSSEDVYPVSSALFAASQVTKRTSTSWFCRYACVSALLAKMQRLFGFSHVRHLEEPQLVRYRTGQEFSWHYDQVPPSEKQGQRVATFLLYLNTLPPNDGGATVFRDLQPTAESEPLAVQPRQGTALLFFPASQDGHLPDERTLHKGQVIYGTQEKKIAQVWIHPKDDTYRPRVPPGNSNTNQETLDAIRQARVALGFETA